MTKKQLYSHVIEWFMQNMPIAETELHFNNHFELLVAVILSAQCTDKRVNMITPALFAKYPTCQLMAEANVEDIYQLIKSCSYPNNKAKHISAMSQKLQSDFNSVVPNNREDLMSLPGVGRKTANVMLAVAFNKPAMAVDTHVFRVSARIGLTTNAKNPLETEQELTKYIPAKLQGLAHHWLILHGRYTCTARNPKCEGCGLSEICFYNNSIINKK